MFGQIVFRMIIGGIVVSGFALLSDILKPKRFAGLFGAAPSIALATLALAVGTNGKLYAANAAHSMMAGAVALLIYTYCIFQLMLRSRHSALGATLSVIPLWAAAAAGIWYICLR
jgi:hypothetical protein